MERALFIAKQKNLKYLTKDYHRIYFGNEFCERLLPNTGEFSKVLRAVQDKGLPLTLVTPYVTESGIKNVMRLLAILPKATEVVFNDWGVLRVIREHFSDLEPILGRLLTKIKRGPRIAHFLGKLPQEALQYLSSTNLDVPIYQRFLSESNVKRIEIDNPFQDIHLNNVPEDLQLSLYIPFTYVTTTRFCLVASCDIPDQKGLIGVFPCRQECRQYTFYLQNPVMPTLLIRKGNTVFYKNPKMPPKPEEKRINRLVIQPEVPL